MADREGGSSMPGPVPGGGTQFVGWQPHVSLPASEPGVVTRVVGRFEDVVEDIVRRVVEEHVRDTGRWDRWLNVKDAAEYLAAPPSRIYDLVAQRKVEFRKDGSRLLFRREWLDAYVEGGDR